MHIGNYDNWKYKVKFSDGTMSDIGWKMLVQEVAKREARQIEEVTFFHPDMPGGTMQIPGNLMLSLWKQSVLTKTAA